LTLETMAFITLRMAVGAILPSLFFVRQRRKSGFALGMAFSITPGNATLSVAECNGRRQSVRPPATGRC
jgi:hypothetical protein